MSTKRIKDPAGLLPDRIKVDFTDPEPGDWEAIGELLHASTPSARIERLRAQPELFELADDLASKLTPDGTASLRLLDEITSAESKLIYLKSASAVIEKIRRKQSSSSITDYDIRRTVAKHRYLKDAAAELGITERQLRYRRTNMNNRKS